MRRLITTLAILLVVVVAGMSALVLLVNPNDFRAYMVRQVEQRSGYQLHLTGNLRWHVWPQLSILAGRMSVTAPGAQQPLVSAENMRLDVNLLPLLSHQLSVKQVMLKNAIIRLTPDSATQRPQNAPIGPHDSSTPAAINGWTFDIGKLKLADSLLIWQPEKGEALNFRELNLMLSQHDRKQASIELSTRVNRDQRDVQLTLKGLLNASDYPYRLSGAVESLDYQFKGVDLPAQGIQGNAAFTADWVSEGEQFSLGDIALTANESQLHGSVSGQLGTHPRFQADFSSPNLNLDNVLAISVDASSVPGTSPSGNRPVIAGVDGSRNEDNPLNAWVSSLKLQVKALRWRGMDLQNVALDAQNQQGLITLNTLNGKIGDGHFSLPGMIDIRTAQTKVTLQPELQDIVLSSLLNAFALPGTIDGVFSLHGLLQGNGLSVAAFSQHWQGNADIALDHARFVGLNFQQMIQQNVARNSDQISAEESNGNDTPFDQLRGRVTLNNGVIALVGLQGSSSRVNFTAQGSVDLAKEQCDVTFGIKVLGGWKGDSALIETLTQTAIPLRIYGQWSSLQYALQVDQLLNKRLQDKAKLRLNQWVDRHPDNNNQAGTKK